MEVGNCGNPKDVCLVQDEPEVNQIPNNLKPKTSRTNSDLPRERNKPRPVVLVADGIYLGFGIEGILLVSGASLEIRWTSASARRAGGVSVSNQNQNDITFSDQYSKEIPNLQYTLHGHWELCPAV